MLWKMPMNKRILLVLIGAMLMQGCYSSSVLEREGRKLQLPADSARIQLDLKNGAIIECEPFHHLAVTAPSNFIYGVGSSMQNSVEREFIGRIDPSTIDSSKAEKGGRAFWLKDGSQVRFGEGEFLVVNSDQGTGLWCMGRKTDDESDALFTGRVEFADIRKIELLELSGWGTAALGGMALFVAFVLVEWIRFAMESP
jgi:hypothetical protein